MNERQQALIYILRCVTVKYRGQFQPHMPDGIYVDSHWPARLFGKEWRSIWCRIIIISRQRAKSNSLDGQILSARTFDTLQI